MRFAAAHGLRRRPDAGAIDQHAGDAMRACRGIERVCDRLFPGHVDGEEEAADGLGERLALLGVAIEDGHLHAGTGKAARGRRAQSRGPAGDHRRQSLKLHGSLLSNNRIAHPVPAMGAGGLQVSGGAGTGTLRLRRASRRAI